MPAAHVAPVPQTQPARSHDPAVAQAARGGGPGGLAVHAPGPLPAVVQRQGGGASLPAPLRQGVERLSGIDMSDVQVHHGSSQPAQLGALAYAIGNQIHLGPGQDHHLPHEAWHVVQQRQGRVPAVAQFAGLPLNDDPSLEREADRMGAQALQLGHAPGAGLPAAARSGPGSGVPALQRRQAPGGGVLQRAVGFEFETGDRIQQRRLGGLYWGELPKARVVLNCGNNVQLTADRNSSGHSVVEMVLDPPVDEANGAQFTQALTTFTNVGAAIGALPAGVPVTLNNIAVLPNGPADVRITPSGSQFHGNPQMTLGVRFDRLIEFLGDAGQARSARLPLHDPGAYELTQYVAQTHNSVQAVQGLVHPQTGAPLSAELQGLLALLANYLKSGRAQPQMLNYAKLISGPFMARTDFSHIFDKLPAADHQYFRNHPDEFADLALQAAGMQNSGGTRLFDRGVRKSNEPASWSYNTDHARTWRSPVGMTRDSWLQGMTNGHDSISSAQRPGKKGTLEGLGALGDRTDRVANDPAVAAHVHDKGRGIILELRQMRLNQSPAQFAVKAQAIFDYVAALNA